MILDLDHVAVAVRRIEARLAFWQSLGLEGGEERKLDSEGVRVRFLSVGSARVELLEPMTGSGPVGKFLERRGEGIHHICFRVDSVEKTARALETLGFPLAGRIRKGAEGMPITFLHPRATGGVLVELSEGPAGPERRETEKGGGDRG